MGTSVLISHVFSREVWRLCNSSDFRFVAFLPNLMASSSQMQEMLEVSPSERLLDFLLQSGCSSGIFNTCIGIFNPPFDLELLVEKAKAFLIEEWKGFNDSYSKVSLSFDGSQFLHLSDIGGTLPQKKKLRKKMRSLPVVASLKQEKAMCPLHSSHCFLVHYSLAFVLHLFTMVELKWNVEDQIPEFPPKNVVLLGDLARGQLQDQEDPFKADEEKRESAGLDVAQFRADSLLPENTTSDVVLSDEILTLPSLPTFHLNGKDFILLSHIQSLFKMREDYCLAIIVESSEAAEGLIDLETEHLDEFYSLDTKDNEEEYVTASNALDECMKRAQEEAPPLSDELFEERLQKLGIADIGKWPSSFVEKDVDPVNSISLWEDAILEDDENIKIEIKDDDKYLGRKKGSRGDSGPSKDKALAHFLPYMNKDIFIIVHSTFSEAPGVPMFCLKVLSRLMGYHPIHFNANKIMLLERTAAIRMFGYAQGFNASRAGYFLCYSAYALALKKKYSKSIVGYNRKTFLRYKGDIPEEYNRKRIKK